MSVYNLNYSLTGFYTEDDIGLIKNMIEIDFGAPVSKKKKIDGIFIACKNIRCGFLIVFRSIPTDANTFILSPISLNHMPDCQFTPGQKCMNFAKEQILEKKQIIYNLMKDYYLETKTFKPPKEFIQQIIGGPNFPKLTEFYRKYDDEEDEDLDHIMKRKIKKKLDNIIGDIRKQILKQLKIEIIPTKIMKKSKLCFKMTPKDINEFIFSNVNKSQIQNWNQSNLKSEKSIYQKDSSDKEYSSVSSRSVKKNLEKKGKKNNPLENQKKNNNKNQLTPEPLKKQESTFSTPIQGFNKLSLHSANKESGSKLLVKNIINPILNNNKCHNHQY